MFNHSNGYFSGICSVLIQSFEDHIAESETGSNNVRRCNIQEENMVLLPFNPAKSLIAHSKQNQEKDIKNNLENEKNHIRHIKCFVVSENN